MPVDPQSLYARGLISDAQMDQLRETPSFGERAAATGSPPSENIEDRRGERMGDAELIARQLRDLAKKLSGRRPPRKTLPPVQRPAGQLPIDAGFDDIGHLKKYPRSDARST
jgi:hypothetical protein